MDGQNMNPSGNPQSSSQPIPPDQGGTYPYASPYASSPDAGQSSSERPASTYDSVYGVGAPRTSAYQGSTQGGGSAFAHAPQSTPQPDYATAFHAATDQASFAGAQAATPPKHQKGVSGAKVFLLAFAGALVAAVLAIGVGNAFGLFGKGSAASNIQLGAAHSSAIEAVEAEQTLAEAVADKCLPSVVSITVYSTSTGSSNPFYDYFYGGNSGQSGQELESGLGSGVILTEDGYIITNNHVVSGGTRFEVMIDGETYEADLVGTDASSDVAVIKAKDASGLKAIEIADSDNIKIGEWVMSIGSPFGLEQSVATGIVSATSRSQIMDSSSSNMFDQSSSSPVIYPNLIQTDAAINPGNSGGALVNANGELIGINTLITSYSGNYSGVGFAIPSNYAIGLAQDIIAGKEPTHAQLGVSLSTVNDQMASRYGFAVKSGAYVSNVSPGSGAESAGIKVGDIITGFDGKQVSSASDLMMDVRTKSPGDKVTVTINRDGQTQDVEVTLGTAQAATEAPTQQNSGQPKYDLLDLFGNNSSKGDSQS